nr:phage tail protein [Cupriavidus sp. amp6]
MDDATVPGGLLYVTGATTNIPMNLGSGVVLHRVYGTAGMQLFFPYSSSRVVFRRRRDNVWQAWFELAITDSPTFIGTPIVPTAAKGTNSGQAASTAFVASAIADLVASSPGTLDTLNELAAALGNDPNFATTITTQLGNKFDKAGGVIGVQTSGWDAINAPTARIVDGGNTQAAAGPNGGLAIESYGPGVQLIDRSVGTRNARLMLDGSTMSIAFDTTAAPGSYVGTFWFNADGYMALGQMSSAALFRLGLTVPGGASTQYGIYNNVEFNEATTSAGATYCAVPRVKDAAFTMANLVGFFAPSPAVGASATVTEYAGFMVNDLAHSNIVRKIGARLRLIAGPDKWNVYADGSASNYLAGKLLIGTTTDSGQLLQVNGASHFAGRLLRGLSAEFSVGDTGIAGVQNAGTGNDGYMSTSRFSNDTNPAGLNIGKSRGNTIGTQGAVLAGDYIARINFCGSDGAGIVAGAQIDARPSENWTSAARGTHLEFRTTSPGSVVRSQKMILTDVGNLLIGSTADDGSSAKLQVTGYATADTPPAGDSTRKLATTAWVMSTLLNAAIGQIIIEPRTTARAGCLKLNGALLNRADYPELWAYAQASGAIVTDAAWLAGSWGCFSHGDGSNTFRIPEYRGEFLRFWDDGRGADVGRGIGVFQDSQNKTHAHTASATAVGDHAHTAWTDAQGWHGHGVSDPTHAHTYDVPPPATDWDGQGAASGGSWLDLTKYGQRGTYGAYTGVSINGDGSHGHNVGIGNAGAHNHTITVNADGGAEVRTRNICALAMIRAF